MGSQLSADVVEIDRMGAARYLLWLCLAGCIGVIEDAGGDPDGRGDAEPPAWVDAGGSLPDAVAAGDCPADMQPVAGACMDRFEAPNQAGAQALVMYTFVEAEAWCQARDKRLCFDDEWEEACSGAANADYVYGEPRVPGKCNDAQMWLPYSQAKLNGWPAGVADLDVETLDELLDRARAAGGTIAADHVWELYQGAGSGSYGECKNEHEVFDLTGSVEEWTRRRDGGTKDFHGNLKGRYWADSRTCSNDLISHGDFFRFYEIGFRCCRDR
jgi:formylglycine-generating enzyme required for sulfatase activity